jgi:hypothetical protein
MCAEVSTVLRAVATDFVFNCWYLEIPSDNCIGHIPRCVHYHQQGFRLKNVLVLIPGHIKKNLLLFISVTDV